MNRNLWGRRALAMLVHGSGGGRRGGGQGQGGHVDHLVGSGAALGNEIRDGFNLALQHTGGKLGGLPAEVVVADDQQRPTLAARPSSACSSATRST